MEHELSQITTRPSRAHRAYHCPLSIYLESRGTATTSQDAERGTQMHRDIAAYIAGTGEPPGSWTDERGILFAQARRLWQNSREYFLAPQCEVALERDGIRGTADVFSRNGPTVAIGDFTLGAGNDESKRLQLLMYAAMALTDEVREAYLFAFYVRAGEIATWIVNHDEIDATWKYLLDNLADARRDGAHARTMRGPHCQWCAGAVECPAIRRDLTTFMQGPDSASIMLGYMSALTPERFTQLVGDLKTFGRLHALAMEAAKAHIQASGGRVGGAVLREVDKRTLRPCLEALRVFSDHGQAEAYRAGVRETFSTTEAFKAVQVPRGSKGTTIDAIKAALEQHGLYDVRTEYHLRLEGEHE